MDFIRNFPMFSVVLSLFSGVLCTILSGKKAKLYTIVYEGVLLVLLSAVLWYTVVTKESFTYVLGEFPAPWGNELRAGTLEASVAVLFIVVMLCAVLAGQRYVQKDIDESKINIYYAIINLMTAALMAMTWTNDIFSGYVFLEILTLTSCGVLIVREIGRTTLAAVRYMILNLVGSGLFLLGVVLLYDITGNLLMVPMHNQIAILYEDPGARTVLIMAVGILTIGLSIKSGLFPFHYWMPDTYGWATPTSAALLSSLVSKSYIFLLIKIYWRVIGIDIYTEMPIRNILFVLGLCGMIFGSLSAIRAENINRMVAFSSAAQIGYIYMGMGLGGTTGFTAAGDQVAAVSHNAEAGGCVRRQPAVQKSAGLCAQGSECGPLFPASELIDDRDPDLCGIFVQALFCHSSGGRRRDQADPGHAGAGGKFHAQCPVLYQDTDPYIHAGTHPRQGGRQEDPAPLGLQHSHDRPHAGESGDGTVQLGVCRADRTGTGNVHVRR